MPYPRAVLHELFLFAAFTGLFGIGGYVLFGVGGAVIWRVVGDWVVGYDDQYDWLADCFRAGRYSGWVGVLAVAAKWVRHRRADRLSDRDVMGRNGPADRDRNGTSEV